MENIKETLIELAKAGIGIRECAAFVIVNGQTSGEIADAVGSARHTMATRLNTLARKGLIERVCYDGASRWVKTDIGYDVMNRAGI
jgi:DNA-binding HxlR family transcriptional regulator